MRIKVFLLLALLMLFIVRAQEDGEDAGEDAAEDAEEDGAEDESTVDIEAFEVEDSKDLMLQIQSINEATIWIVEFHDSDPEEELMDQIKEGLGKERYEDESYQELKYRFISLDVNDGDWDDAMDDLGMTSNDFQGTYPVALVMRKRKGLFAWGYELSEAILERLWEVADEKISPYA